VKKRCVVASLSLFLIPATANAEIKTHTGGHTPAAAAELRCVRLEYLLFFSCVACGVSPRNIEAAGERERAQEEGTETDDPSLFLHAKLGTVLKTFHLKGNCILVISSCSKIFIQIPFFSFVNSRFTAEIYIFKISLPVLLIFVYKNAECVPFLHSLN
jgi:hypothetical protein